MNRRAVISLIGGAAAAPSLAWPRPARAQKMRQVGAIMNYAETDREGQARLSALRDGLHRLGWVEGSNIRLEYRWAGGQTARMQTYATELVGLPAEVIVVNSTPLVGMLIPLARTIPIVFVQVADPVSSGFVSSYARPSGNITGFTDFDTSIAGKWVEVLKEAAPSVKEVAVLLHPEQVNHHAFWDVIKSTAPSLQIQPFAARVHTRLDIEEAITSLAGQPDRGLIVLPGPLNNTLRDPIIQLTARHRVPAIYPFKYYAKEGGLLYYGNDQVDQWPKAAGYVDRILHGEKPGNLPVQAPTKFELIVNMKTAKALGLDVPPTLLARADEVIE